MSKLKNFVQDLHNSTKRNYLERMSNDKSKCMKVAREFGKDFWDGERKYGYGGYKYIEDYWENVAINFIKNYKLNNTSKVLDVGCGKGFLLYEIKKILPGISICGFDISEYAIKNNKKEIKDNLFVYDAGKKYPFSNNYFDLALSLATLHNLEINNLQISLSEIDRVSKNSYLMVESYRNENELFNLQCWALTCKAFFSLNEWLWLFKQFNYNGDYEFIYFE